MAATSNSYTSAAAPASAQRGLSLRAANRSYLLSSIGTKVLVGATGLLLFLYLLLHLAGNLLVFLGASTFNGYSYVLIHNPLVIPVEIGLLAVFILHVYKTVTNWIANRRARPQGYHQPAKRYFGWGWARHTSRKSLASTTMIVTGTILFVFILIHLRQFKFGAEYLVTDPSSGVEMRDLYRLDLEQFGNVFNVIFYVLCMIVVGAHVWHGFGSAFSSLGADHPRVTPWVLRAGRLFAVLIAGGFIAIPVWIYFAAGR